MSSLQQARLARELARLDNRGIYPGLKRLAKVADALGSPQNRFPAILIGGTNGKGSVSALLEAAFRLAGYKTGLYTSPHLIHYTERVRVNGREILPEMMRELLESALTAARRAGVPLTQFEALTLTAFLSLARERVDMAIIEVGLGGRWDATNILGRVMAAAVTNVEFDHTEWLGNTRTRIAREKAGILRPGVPIVTAATREGLSVIENVARRLGSPLYRLGQEFHARTLKKDWVHGTQSIAFSRHSEERSDEESNGEILRFAQNDTFERFHLRLLGSHQVENAAVALAVLNLMGKAGYHLPERILRKALRKAQWPGRLEFLTARVSGRPIRFLLDGAHNPAGATALAESLAVSPWKKKRLTLLFGCMKDKDAGSMIRQLLPCAGRVLTVGLDSNRSASPVALCRLWRRHNVPATTFSNLQKALKALPRINRKTEPILATGSLYLVGQLKSLFSNGVPRS
jgi:dihydrofolate synthase/folylpolyglutamate synthase